MVFARLVRRQIVAGHRPELIQHVIQLRMVVSCQGLLIENVTLPELVIPIVEVMRLVLLGVLAEGVQAAHQVRVAAEQIPVRMAQGRATTLAVNVQPTWLRRRPTPVLLVAPAVEIPRPGLAGVLHTARHDAQITRFKCVMMAPGEAVLPARPGRYVITRELPVRLHA